MANAGYSESQYEILAQTYSAPLPAAVGHPLPGDRLHAPDDRRLRRLERRRQLGAQHRRRGDEQLRPQARPTGMSNVKLLDMAARSTGAGCARTPSACSRRRASPPGRAPDAVDKTEWVHQIRTITTIFPPYQLQEDGHPNYWGQLALRNCFRQATTAAPPRGGLLLARHRPQRATASRT